MGETKMAGLANIKIVIFDLDGTVIFPHAVKSSINYYGLALGIEKEWEETITRFHRSELNGVLPQEHTTLFQVLSALLKDKPVAPVIEILDNLPYTKGFGTFCSYLQQEGIRTALVSHSDYIVGKKVQAKYSIDCVVTNEYHTYQGRFTGEGTIRVPFGKKGDVVKRVYTLFGADYDSCCYIGDSANDVDPWKAVSVPLGMNIGKQHVPYVLQHFTDFFQVKTYFEDVLERCS